MTLNSPREEIFSEQAARLFRGVPAAIVGNLVNATILGVMLRDVANPIHMRIWAVAFIVMIVVRLGLYLAYQKRQPELHQNDAWVKAMIAVMMLLGLVWGLAAWVFMPFGQPQYHVLTAMILFVISTAGMSGLFSVLTAYIVFVIPIMTLLMARFILIGSDIHFAMAASGGVLLVFMVYFAKRHRDDLIKTLMLRIENRNLLARMKDENLEVRHENEEMLRMEALLRKKSAVLDAVSQVQGLFIANRSPDKVFDETLQTVLGLTRSDYGFVGEVLRDEDGERYFKAFAFSDLSWDDATRALYDERLVQGLEFHDQENLFGNVLKTGDLVLANDPANDPRAGGLPKGHPDIHSFLGVPLYMGEEMVGMFGIANREGGYDLELVTSLEPVINAAAGMVAAVQNRRERDEAQFDAAYATERLYTAIESLNDGFVIFDRDDRLVLCNSKYKELYRESVALLVPGMPFEKILRDGVARNQFDLGWLEAEDWVQERLALHRKQSSLTEQRLSDGTWLRIEERATPDGGRVGFRVDITAMKETQERLRTSEEKFRTIVQSTEEGYWLIDSNTKETIEVNDALCRMLGYAPEEIKGKRPSEFCDAENAEIFKRQTGKIDSTDHRCYEITLQHKDGRSIPTYFNATTMYDDGGKAVSAFAFVTDLSELKRAQEELQRAMAETEKASRAKTEFLSSMSHELRTPMNAVLGFAQLLEMNPQLPLHPKQRGAVEQIIKAGNHLLELINEILDLSRIESGHINLTMADVDPHEVVEECFIIIEPLAEKRTIDLDIDVPPEHGFTIHADRTRFKQVLLNLLSNAVKYNVLSGRVTLSIHSVPGRPFVRFCVSDTGPGIPKDKQGELFEPFSRLGAETSDIEGTGIGLTIARKLTELMGGQLNFESVPGQGSQFWVDLPGHAGEQAEHPGAGVEENALPSIGGGHCTVLYVEDNPDNLLLMEHVIAMVDGVELMSAHTGELGVEMAEIHRPNVILMDINLPGISGIEALKRLREMEETRAIPVIAISADAMSADIQRGLEAGFDAYLTKPINLQEVVEHIRLASEGKLP